MRTRILPRMLNDEVEEYLSRNDIIIVSRASAIFSITVSVNR